MLVSVALLILFVLLVHSLILFNSRKTRNLAPGPTIWPLIGSVFEIKAADPKYPHLALAKLAKKYGNIMGIGFGSTYSVVISGFREMKDIMSRTEASDHRFLFPFARDRSFNQNLGIIWSGGDVWQEMRRFTIRTLRDFGFGKKTTMEAAIKIETEAAVEAIHDSIRRNNGIWNVDTNFLATLSINVVWSLVGGYRFDHNDPSIEKNQRLNDSIIKIVGHDNIDNVYPGLKKWFPWLVPHESQMQTHQALQSWIMSLVEDAKQRRSERVDTDALNFIEVILDEIENNRGSESNFTDKQMIVTLLDIFLAGSETTSTALSYTILFLTINPECQRKLQMEVRDASKRLGHITIRDAAKLTYLNAVMLESFRLGNMTPIPTPRLAAEDIYFENIVIPKGTAIFANMAPVLMDEQFWGDPTVFRPERFIENYGSIKSELVERVAVFGFGKRKCIAVNLAYDTLMMFLIALYGNFTFEAIKGHEPSAANPLSSFTIQPRPYSVRGIANSP